MEDTQYFTTHPSVSSNEKILRFLARESRFRRRILSAALFGLIRSAPLNMCATRYSLASSPQDPYYVFLTLPQFDSITYEQYREMRRDLLKLCCLSVKLKFSDAQHVVGIATESGNDENGRSEDALYIDVTDWSEEDANRIVEVSKKMAILENPKMFTHHAQEYPL